MLVAELERRLIDELEQKDAAYSIGEGRYGKTYYLSRPQATLEVTIDQSWIGCDLSIDKNIVGREIGFAVDTDNYPITEKFHAGNMEVYDECIECLQAFICDEIYVGRIEGKPALAMPTGVESYRVTVFKRFSARTQVMSGQDLKAMKSMRRLSEYQTQE